jgi:hypothetical protein
MSSLRIVDRRAILHRLKDEVYRQTCQACRKKVRGTHGGIPSIFGGVERILLWIHNPISFRYVVAL